MEEPPFVEPELGVSPFAGSFPFLRPVEVADAILPEADKDDAGAEVILIPPGEVKLPEVAVPVPGKGAMEGAEKFPNPLGTPVLLGTLPVRYRREGGGRTMECLRF